MSGFIGCGKVYIERKIAGVWQGMKEAGEASRFEIKENTELKQRISRSCDSYGSPVDSVVIKKPADINVTLSDLKKENLAAVFLGEYESSTIAAATVTGELVSVATKDSVIKTASPNISALTVTSTGGGTTYAEGTDYAIVNAKVGLIKVLEAGSIPANTDFELAYSSGETTRNKITGGTKADVPVRFMLVGQNIVDQSNVIVQVWDATASPEEGFDFLSEDFSELKLAGTLNVDADKGNAYEVDTDITYA